MGRGVEPLEPTVSTAPAVSPLDSEDESESDAWLRRLAAAPSFRPPLSIGSVIDEAYRVEAVLGRGGMGTVYLAHDVQLDRRVALKVHRGPLGDRSQWSTDPRLTRLRREAKAMARLSHPNVLTVYEVGTFDDQLYIAMDYAEGGTLRGWFEKEHRWPDIVEMIIEVARGVAAAHGVGIVHRDLKPENVLLRADGRPQVADFGLARTYDSRSDRVPTTSVSTEDDPEISREGTVAGTAAYMSAEQFCGGRIGPASDQFALCVMLYEGLFGRRPFPGNTVFSLSEAVCAGRRLPRPSHGGVPRRLVRAIERGLDPDPDRRHPSVDHLIAELQAALRGPTRRRWLVASLGLTTIASGLGFVAARGTQAEPCRDSETALAGTWDRDVAAALQSRFTESESVIAVFDDYAKAWIEARREACEATRVRGEQSDLALDLRMACFERHRARMHGIVTGLLEQATLRNLDDAWLRTELPPLEACSDLETLEHLGNRLATVSSRDRAEQDRAWVRSIELLGRARAKLEFGGVGALELARQAGELGRVYELPLVRAEAAFILGDAAHVDGDLQRADQLYVEALGYAAADGSPREQVLLMLERSAAALQAGDVQAAEIHLAYADMFRKQLTASRATKHVDALRANAFGHLALARGEARAALEAVAPLLDDPDVEVDRQPALLEISGRAHHALGDHESALARFSAALRLVEAAGVGKGARARLLNNIGNTELDLGRYEDAVRTFLRALEEAERDGNASLQAQLRGNLGLAYRLAGDLQQARSLQELSLQQRVDSMGDQHPSVAYALDELAELARIDGQHDRALQFLNRAGRIRDGAFGPGHPLVAETLTRMGRVLLDLGKPDDAAEPLRVALEIRTQHEVDPLRRAETEMWLGVALRARQPVESTALLERARGRLETLGERGAELLKTLDAVTAQ